MSRSKMSFHDWRTSSMFIRVGNLELVERLTNTWTKRSMVFAKVESTRMRGNFRAASSNSTG